MSDKKNKAKKNNKDKNNSKLFIKLGIVVSILIVFGISIVGFMSHSEQEKLKTVAETDTIYENIYINDINVGGLTKEEAEKKLQAEYAPSSQDNTITVKSGDKAMEIKYADLKPVYDFTEAINEAYDYARVGDMNDRYDKISALETTPYDITYEPKYTYDDSIVTAKITEFSKQLYLPAENATVDMENGKYVITPEKKGQQADIPAAVKEVSKLVSSNESGEIELVITEVEPEITAVDFESSTSVIGTYSTSFTGSLDIPRNVNLNNASTKLNGTVVYPGEVFSTNAAFGEMSYDNGYRNAPVIQGGKLVDGIGGGICQVSTTLYDAILYAELDIVERQNHSMKVGYADYGYDATLAGDYIDFKFKNDTEYPIMIESYIVGNKLTVNIYGHEIHDPSRKLEFSNALIETLYPGAENVIEDPTLPKGTRVEVTPSRVGYKYEVYKTVYENGKKVETVTVNTSSYKPIRGEVKVGTGESVEIATTPPPVTPTPTTQEIPDVIEGTPTPNPVEPTATPAAPPVITPAPTPAPVEVAPAPTPPPLVETPPESSIPPGVALP